MTDADYRSYPENVQAVLRKYYLIQPKKVVGQDGQTQLVDGWATSDIEAKDAKGQPLGKGHLLDPDVVNRFLKADATPEKVWFDWMLFQSGGGKDAKSRGANVLSKAKLRFLVERKKGYNEGGRWIPPVSPAAAEEKWKAVERDFVTTLSTGDNDLVDRHHIFGFYRHWPGKNRIYERVAMAVTRFQKLARKIKETNAYYQKNGDESEMIGLSPNDYPTVDALENAVKRIERFHMAKTARNDIRVETVYDDDYITVICPLTYAAAVRYGWDQWPWANRDSFEQQLTGKAQSWANKWGETTQRNSSVFLYIQFKVPMPSWVAFKGNRFVRSTLHNLALVVPAGQLKSFNPDTVKLYDEDSHEMTSLGQIKAKIQDEGKREWNPDQEEYPIQRGPRVYKDENEATEVVRHLDAAMDGVKEWGMSFDPSKVVGDFMGGLDA